ncbi:MAG: PIN domain-containing protein [Acidobacteriota bacterium]
MGLMLLRVAFVFLMGFIGFQFPPYFFSGNNFFGAGFAMFLALVALYVEHQIKKTQFTVIWGATMGTIIGVFLGYLFSLIFRILAIEGDKHTIDFINYFFLIIMPYMGFVVGSKKSEWFNPATLFTFFKEKSAGRSYKILDTSVIIDGRISDICDTEFIEGTLIIPQFVLKELQLVADSSDNLKRQRGRRGLDILQRLQKTSGISVVISELDFPEKKDVDAKLIELAKTLDAKIITNDFNLNKIAQLQGIRVLNINELANSLKPVVLPGETMKVFILKEGKEKDQGVAYLDDGTMVVVDNSRKMIGKNIEITVTSVLQTTAGKMIFGRYNE